MTKISEFLLLLIYTAISTENHIVTTITEFLFFRLEFHITTLRRNRGQNFLSGDPGRTSRTDVASVHVYHHNDRGSDAISDYSILLRLGQDEKLHQRKTKWI